jgi:hypothetical protein
MQPKKPPAPVSVSSRPPPNELAMPPTRPVPSTQAGLADAAEIVGIARELQLFAESPQTTLGWPRIFQVWGRV